MTSRFKFKSVPVPEGLRFFEPWTSAGQGRGLNDRAGDMVTGAYDVFDRESGVFIGTVFKSVKLFLSFADLGSGFRESVTWVTKTEEVNGETRCWQHATRASAARWL